MLTQRQRVPEGSATAKAIDYSLRRWDDLMRYLDDGASISISKMTWPGAYSSSGRARSPSPIIKISQVV